jgi:hypothetical protein
MAKKFEDAEVTSRYIAELVRKRALKAIAKHDEALSRVYDKVAEGIRRDLRAIGFSVPQVREILEKHLGGTAEERQRIIEQSIVEAAREARTLDKETFEAIFGAEEVAQAPAPFAPSSKATKLRSVSPPPASEDEPPSTD